MEIFQIPIFHKINKEELDLLRQQGCMRQQQFLKNYNGIVI